MATAENIVARFGGPSVLGGLLGGVRQNTVSMWVLRGSVPGKWHLTLLRLAREQGIELSADELELSTTSRGRAA